MALFARWVAVLSTAVVAGVLVPVAAWASASPTVLAGGDELARRRLGGFGFLASLCCLAVVLVVVLAVVLVTRGRRRE